MFQLEDYLNLYTMPPFRPEEQDQIHKDLTYLICYLNNEQVVYENEYAAWKDSAVHVFTYALQQKKDAFLMDAGLRSHRSVGTFYRHAPNLTTLTAYIKEMLALPAKYHTLHTYEDLYVFLQHWQKLGDAMRQMQRHARPGIRPIQEAKGTVPKKQLAIGQGIGTCPHCLGVYCTRTLNGKPVMVQHGYRLNENGDRADECPGSLKDAPIEISLKGLFDQIHHFEEKEEKFQEKRRSIEKATTLIHQKRVWDPHHGRFDTEEITLTPKDGIMWKTIQSHYLQAVDRKIWNNQELIHRYKELIVTQFDSVYDLTAHLERAEERKLYESRKTAYEKELAHTPNASPAE